MIAPIFWTCSFLPIFVHLRIYDVHGCVLYIYMVWLHQVRLYKWEEGELVLECSYSDTILALFIKCHGDFILVRFCFFMCTFMFVCTEYTLTLIWTENTLHSCRSHNSLQLLQCFSHIRTCTCAMYICNRGMVSLVFKYLGHLFQTWPTCIWVIWPRPAKVPWSLAHCKSICLEHIVIGV